MSMNRAGLVGAPLVALSVLAMTAMAEGRPGEGIRLSDWTLSPFVDLSATWDSNALRTGDDQAEDVFYDAVGGVNGAYSSGKLSLQVGGYIMTRGYSEESDLDYSGGGENASLSFGDRKSLSVSLYQSYMVTEDTGRYGVNYYNVGSLYADAPVNRQLQTRNETLTFGVGLSRDLTDKIGAGVNYAYSETAYDADSLQDVADHRFSASGSYFLTDKTSLNLSGTYGTSDDGVLTEAANTYSVNGGISTRATEKLTFSANVGWSSYSRPDPEVVDAGYTGSDDSTVSYNLAATWMATDKMSVQAGAQNGYSQSAQYAGNASLNSSVFLGLGYRMSDTVSLSWINTYRQDEYLDPIEVDGESRDRTEKGYGSHVTVSYATPAKFMSVYGSAGYEKVEAVEDDYDQVRVSIGTHLQY